MAFISSPIQYPYTSSPQMESPQKKRKLSHHRGPRKPLQSITNESSAPRTVAGFLVEDESDDEATLSPTWRHCGAPAQEDLGTRHTDGFENPHELQSLSPINTLPTPPAKRSDTLDPRGPLIVQTCGGKSILLRKKSVRDPTAYESLIAERSEIQTTNVQKSYYGIDIHSLVTTAENEVSLREASKGIENPVVRDTIETPTISGGKISRTLMWTEKYRARKFTDLVGDERTHRAVLHWFKAWDQIVFPHQQKSKSRNKFLKGNESDERPHRKILLLTGPPGLGKTTLAHVCAKQAGYEAQEINASDERSRDVVRGRIRDMVGTENVKSISVGSDGFRKAAKPVCVIVDEVDGVTTGSSSGGGDGGFMKALLELISIDQRNSATLAAKTNSFVSRGRRKGDNFRMLRPLILICNDLYHPALRPLRQSNCAEIVHVRKPAINMVIPRMQSIFVNEGVLCDSDGVRHLCEAAWGVSTRKEDRTASNGACEGDIRSILVLGEWVASKLRSFEPAGDEKTARLTKRWIEKHLLNDLAYGGSAARSLGRGGSREVADRVFLHNAGFPKVPSSGNGRASNGDHAAEAGKIQVMERLREMIASSGDDDRIMTDVFTSYPTTSYQDDTFLTKPKHAYDWLHFHNTTLGLVQSHQEWELAPYLSYPVLAFHKLFAGNLSARATNSLAASNADAVVAGEATAAALQPYTGLRAPFSASEATKVNSATLSAFQSALSVPLQRSFRNHADLATELIPYVLRIMNPEIKPVVVGGSGAERGIASVRKGSEKALVTRSVNAMIAVGLKFERARLAFGEENYTGPSAGSGGWIMRMEPALDDLGTYQSLASASASRGKEKVRYAVRQVLDQEHERELKRLDSEARRRRAYGEAHIANAETSSKDEKITLAKVIGGAAGPAVKRDFFGRPIITASQSEQRDAVAGDGDGVAAGNGNGSKRARAATGQGIKDRDEPNGRIWVTYHEGFSNAVRKPITLKELLEGL